MRLALLLSFAMDLDLKAAVRALTRTPAFTVGAVLTLGLALGVLTTALGLLVGALGGKENTSSDRVMLYLTERVGGRDLRTRWPHAGITALQSARSFDAIASYTTATLNLSGIESDATRVDVELVSPSYFDIVGVAPLAGRSLPTTSEVAARSDEVVIGHGLWLRLFGGSPEAIGRSVRISRRPLTIVGVMPEGFRGLSGRAEIWIPHTRAPQISYAGYFTSDEYFHNVVARLRPDVSLDQARSELSIIASQMARAVPARSDNATARGGDIVLLNEARTNEQTVRARLYVALGAVLVLLIAALNLANLIVSRVNVRQREFAVRLAIGASRLRILRSIGVEMALVTGAGLGVALLAAIWVRDLIASILPANLANPANDYGQIASFSDLTLSVPVFAGVAVLAGVTMALVSIVACRPLLKSDVLHGLQRAGPRTIAGPGRTQRVLLGPQIALAIVLLTSAGLLFRTVAALSDIRPGFNAENVLAFSVAEDLSADPSASGPALVDRLLTTLRDVPGIAGVTVGQCTPYGTRCARLLLRRDDQPETATAPIVGWHRVGPAHFETLGIPIVRGRGFTRADNQKAAPIVVINETAARRLFGDRDPIGARIYLPQTLSGDAATAEIVGVVGDVVYWPPNEPPGPDVYQPALQFSYSWTTVMLGTTGTPTNVLPAVRAAMRAMDPNLPLFDIVTLSELGRAGRADRRFLLVLLAVCAALGMLLASIGVYALAASWMEARRRELGVRVALGAQPTVLLRLVMTSTLWHAGVGLAGGLLVAGAAGRLLQATLFGVEPHDPLTLAFAGVTMLLVASVAAYVPARRALNVDPVRELNAE